MIGIDERNQFDWYRDVPGIRELVAAFQQRDVRVFVDYNPWDVGTRREPVGDAAAVAELVRELGADGVFLDTMKEAMPELRAALPDAAFEGESTLPLARIADHHLSWAQWFADSDVPGVIRARWFEQRHMLHHTRRWNRSHAEELRSAWLNGVGVLVWENVFGSWVGWNERDRGLLRGMVDVQRRWSHLLTHGDWTPLAARSDDLQVVGSSWRLGDEELWALANRADEPFDGRRRARRAQPAVLVAAARARSRHARGRGCLRRRLRRVPGSGDGAVRRARGSRRRCARRVRRGRARAVAGAVPPARDGHLRRGAVRRGMEAAAAAPARLRRGRASGSARAASRSPSGRSR